MSNLKCFLSSLKVTSTKTEEIDDRRRKGEFLQDNQRPALTVNRTHSGYNIHCKVFSGKKITAIFKDLKYVPPRMTYK